MGQFAATLISGTGSVREALGSLASGLGQMLGSRIGGPLGAFLGPVFGALGGLIGRKRKGIVVEKVIDPITVRPESLSFGLGMNPASALLSGRAFPTGAGYMVVDFKNGADKLVNAWVGNQNLLLNQIQGVI